MIERNGTEPREDVADLCAQFLQSAITDLAGVGAKRAQLLQRIGVATLGDLLHHFPRRHVDLGWNGDRSALVAGEAKSFEGRIERLEFHGSRGLSKGRWIAELRVAAPAGNATGTEPASPASNESEKPESTGDDFGVRLVWFQSRSRAPALQVGWKGWVSGTLQEYDREWQLTHPRFSSEKEPGEHDCLLPIYPATEGLSQGILRKTTRALLGDSRLQSLPDHIPGLAGPRLVWCYRQLHFPDDHESLSTARLALADLELAFLCARQWRIRQHLAKRKSIALPYDPTLHERIQQRVGFSLTRDQERAIAQIVRDMGRSRPMRRLLYGDVGSGKSAVAFWASLVAVAAGVQVAILAPTVVLAQQLHDSLGAMLSGSDVRLELLTGKVEKEVAAQLQQGEVQIAVGTHALMGSAVRFRRLGLVVIDEEHRFGVLQRVALMAKGNCPHTLQLSATPIPRSLARVRYGEYDFSQLEQLPAGRKPIPTRWVEGASAVEALDVVAQELDRGHRALFVAPRVDSGDQGRSVDELRQILQRTPLKEYPSAILHGRLTHEQQGEIIDAFRRGELAWLVTTTVIEVGLDVPELTVVWIDEAHRFGLSQLHQLRGRVGRSPRQSHCFFTANSTDEVSRERLRRFAGTQNGLELAEFDLRARGAGQLFGTRQSGRMGFRLVDLLEDADRFDRVRQRAGPLLQRRRRELREPGIRALADFFGGS